MEDGKTEENSPLTIAAANGDLDILDLLIEAKTVRLQQSEDASGRLLNIMGRSVMKAEKTLHAHHGRWLRHADLVHQIAADPNMTLTPGMLMKQAEGADEHIEPLIPKNRTEKANTPFRVFHFAILQGDVGLVTALVRMGTDLNAEISPPELKAMRKCATWCGDSLPTYEQLDPVGKPWELFTGVLLAARLGYLEILRILLDAGALPLHLEAQVGAGIDTSTACLRCL